jgi:hypothetical protein
VEDVDGAMQERDERIMWEQYHISRMNEADLDLRQIHKL